MKPPMPIITSFLLVLMLALPGFAQPPSNVEAIRGFFSGQRLLVTYREGGAQYGTFFFLQVQFCRSGRYITSGQSRRHTVLDHVQINNFTDEGSWDIATFQGQTFLRYLSVSGQANALPARVLPDGRVSIGEGVSLEKQGAAQCQ